MLICIYGKLKNFHLIFQDDGVEENGHHLPILETPTPPDGYIPQSSLAVPVSEKSSIFPKNAMKILRKLTKF